MKISAYEDPVNPSALALAAVQMAEAEMGHGEEGSNNRGQHVIRYRRGIDTSGAWCAAFVSYCFEEAALRMSEPLPFQRSLGAKRLFKRMCKAGDRRRDPIIGDVACWDRGRAGSWQGHVGIVTAVGDNIFWTIEGNRGTYPSKVRKYLHEIGEGRLVGFARI